MESQSNRIKARQFCAMTRLELSVDDIGTFNDDQEVGYRQEICVV